MRPNHKKHNKHKIINIKNIKTSSIRERLDRLQGTNVTMKEDNKSTSLR